MAAATDDHTWDVLVVGAGPAGASAALAAAKSGARTLMLERAAFPRYKTCGGGLVGASLDALPANMAIPEIDSIKAATFTYRGKYPRTHRHRCELFKMVYRADFDECLSQAAKAAGVEIRDGTAVKSIATHENRITVLTDQGTLEARAVVGCDGSAGRIGRYVGVEYSQIDLGLELELDATELNGLWRGRVHLDWGPLPGSYGWVFPKGESLTVGVIAAKGQGETTRMYLDQLISDLHLNQLPVIRDSGHLTKCRRDGSPLARGRILVAGDAAGLLEPWTREGISYALRSGNLAGNAAARIAGVDTGREVDRISDDYTAAVEQQLGTEMRAGATFMQAFSNRPWLFHAAIGMSPVGWLAFVKLSTGETTFNNIYKRWPVPSVLRLARLPLFEEAICRQIRAQSSWLTGLLRDEPRHRGKS